MIKNYLFIFCIFFLTFCNNRQDSKSVTSIDTTKKLNTTSIEKELPFYDSTTMSKNGETGYQDTFTVDKQKFRVIHHDTLYDGTVQKLNNASWTDILSFQNLGNHNDYEIDKDLNNDGYNDICLHWKWDMEVFFYEPKQKTFLTSSVGLSYDWFLLDPKQGLYCNYQETKTAEATSELYTIKDNKQFVHYIIDFEANEDDNQILQKIVLSKCDNGNEEIKTKIEELKVVKNVEFDYKKWWTENYKRLMGSSQH